MTISRPVSSTRSTAHPRRSRPARWAIVGCGRIANTHAAAIQAVEGATLVACVDPDPAARERARARWSVQAFGDLAALLAFGVDAACVCSPPAAHRPAVERLLEDGVDVLCEKPLAGSVPDAAAMVAAAGRSGRWLVVSAKFRHVSDLHEARALVEDGAIGRPLAWEVSFCARVPVGGWRVRPGTAGGGVVMDAVPDALDVLATAGAAEVETVAAAFGPRAIAPSVEDTAWIGFELADGALARMSLSWSQSGDPDYLVVHGTEGTLRVGRDGGRVRPHGDAGWNAFGTGYDEAAAFRAQLADALAHAPQDPWLGPRAVALAERAYQAERTGRRLVVRAPLTLMADGG